MITVYHLHHQTVDLYRSTRNLYSPSALFAYDIAYVVSNIYTQDYSYMYDTMTTGYPKVENSGHRSRAIETDQARAKAMGAVPHAYARAWGLSIALEACVTDIRHPASCPLAAGQARALAGWPHA